MHMCWYILLHKKLYIEFLLVSKIFLWCSFMNVPAIRLIPFKQRINFWSWLITGQKSLEILNRSMIQNLSTSSFQAEVGLTARISTVQVTFSKMKLSFLENGEQTLVKTLHTISGSLKSCHSNIAKIEQSNVQKWIFSGFIFFIKLVILWDGFFRSQVFGSINRGCSQCIRSNCCSNGKCSRDWKSKIKYVSYSR